MKLCKDKDCLRYGIALNDSEFPKNKVYASGLHIYCKVCCRRRSQEYRELLSVLRVRTQVILPQSVYIPKL